MKPYRATPLVIVAIMVFLILLNGCAGDQITPEPAPTEIPLPHSPTPSPGPLPSAIPSPMPIPSPTQMGREDLLSYLRSRAELNPNNIDQIELLGETYLEFEELPFHYHTWSENGEWLAVCYPGSPDVYKIYQIEEGRSIFTIELVENDPYDDLDCGLSTDGIHPDPRIQSVVFSRDGDLIALPHENGHAVYQTFTGTLVSELDFYLPALLEQIAFSSQGTRIAAGFYFYRAIQGGGKSSNEVHLFDTQSGEHWGIFHQKTFWYLTDLAYSTEGEYLLTAGWEGVEAWSVGGGQLPMLPCRDAEITFSPTEESAALACRPDDDHENWRQLIWNIADNEIITLEQSNKYQIMELYFSSDGEMLVGFTNSGQLSIWESELGTHLFDLEFDLGKMVNARFILDNKALALLDSNGKLSIYGLGGEGQ